MGWGILGGEPVRFRSGDATIQGHLGRPASDGRFPAVILLHGIKGLEAGNKRACERFGDAGYVALGIDWMSRVEWPSNIEIVQYVADAAQFLRQQPNVDGERIAVGGYCKGGALAYLALAELPWLWAGLIYHGTLAEDSPDRSPQLILDAAPRIQAPMLILHGAADPRSLVQYTFALVQEFERLGKTFQLKVYSGARHAFALPGATDYDPAAAADAWDETVAFLGTLRRR
jgi:carboxymethylenebutenolidase